MNLNCLGDPWVMLFVVSMLSALLQNLDPLFPHPGLPRRALATSAVALTERCFSPKPQHIPICACVSISPQGFPGVLREPTWQGQGVFPHPKHPLSAAHPEIQRTAIAEVIFRY